MASRLKYLAPTTCAFLGALLCYPLKANAAPVLQIKPISWDVIGLDSNKPGTDGPDTFNIGARVCNVGDAKATNVTANFVRQGTTNSYITMTGSTTLTIPSLPAGASFHNPGNTGPTPANCTDFYFNAKITRDTRAYNTTQPYQINVSAKEENGNSLATVSTPAGRQLYIEKLVSQNRNDVLSFNGPTSVQVGDVITYTISGSTSTTYEQLVFATNFPNSIFQVLKISTDYTQNGVSNNANYADACGWDPNPSSAKYRSCIGPANYPGGKVGNTFTTTYQVKIISAGSANVTNLVYDFSGSSYHYNSDYGGAIESKSITATAATQADLSLTKTVNSSTPTVGQNVVYTITVNNSGPDNATNVKVKDILPVGLSYVSSSDNVGGFYNPNTGIWDVGTVPRNGSATLQITAKVNAVTPIINTAEVSASDQTDPDSTPNNNNASEDDQASVTINRGGSISGTLYQDLNANNNFNSGEPTLPASITVRLLDSSNNVITTTTTNSSGNYSFPNRSNGSYTIQVDTTDSDIPVGYALTTPNNVAVTISGADISNLNFGFQSPKISGYKSVKLTNDADSSNTVTQGDTLNWTLSYANTGSIDVSNFQVTDALPSGVKIAGTPTISANTTQGTAPTANTSYNGTGTNTLFNSPVTLKAGGVITAIIPVTIDSGVTGVKSNQATGNGSNLSAGIATDNIDNTTTGLPAGVTVPTNSINQTQTASIDPTTINVLAPTTDLSINKTDGQSNINPSSPITYTITVTNNGPSTVNSVKVTDTVPASIQNPTFTPSTGSYNSSTGDWTGLNLASGQSITLTLRGTVSSTATGTITNTATVAPPTGVTDPNSTNNISTDTTTIPVADLSITKTDSPDPVNAGANLTYAIAVTNNGSSTATNVNMSDPLPSGTTFQSITAPSGWSCTTPAVGSNGTVSCTNTSFAVGSANFTIVVKVDPNTANATILNNTATVSSSTADTNSSNNSSSQTTTVQQLADLSLTKVADPPSPPVGGIFDYIITVTNDGPSTATNVKVKDQLPTGVIYATSLLDTSTQGTYDRGTGEWGVGTLAPGASATLRIRAIRNVIGSTVNTAEVIAADQPDPDSPHGNHVVGEDDQDSVTVPSQSVDLAVTKTVDRSTPTVGQNVTFTITVTNPSSSTAAATGVGLTDVLPTGLTYQSHTVSTGAYNSGNGVWSIGTLNSGTTATLTIIATVTTPGAKTNTAQLSDLDQTDTNTGNNTASATVTASFLTPRLSLVKRITAINDNRTQNPTDATPLNVFVNDPDSTVDDDPNWSNRNTYLKGAIDGGRVKPGDEVEYTIYFLNNQAPATNVAICDLIPTHQAFVSTGYNTASPHPTEAGALASDTGLALALDGNTLPTTPTFYLTNTNDSDRGRYYPPNDPSTPSACKKIDAQNNSISSGAAANTNGAIVVEVVRGTGAANQLPPATAPGTPSNSYGFIRFKAKVD